MTNRVRSMCQEKKRINLKSEKYGTCKYIKLKIHGSLTFHATTADNKYRDDDDQEYQPYHYSNDGCDRDGCSPNRIVITFKLGIEVCNKMRVRDKLINILIEYMYHNVITCIYF